MAEVFEQMPGGSYRAVFLVNSHLVFKAPRSDYGLFDNAWEAHEQVDFPTALCFRGSLLGVDGLFMERIQPHTGFWHGLPAWTLKIDGYQVGWSAAGNLVAYDWGPPHREC